MENVFIVPTLSCSGAYINDALPADGGTITSRHNNAAFRCSELQDLEDITNPLLIHLDTTCTIEAGAEVFASYGENYWKTRIEYKK